MQKGGYPLARQKPRETKTIVRNERWKHAHPRMHARTHVKSWCWRTSRKRAKCNAFSGVVTVSALETTVFRLTKQPSRDVSSCILRCAFGCWQIFRQVRQETRVRFRTSEYSLAVIPSDKEEKNLCFMCLRFKLGMTGGFKLGYGYTII